MLAFVDDIPAGGWMVIALTVGTGGAAIWLHAAGHGKDYRSLRWPIAAAVLIGTFLVASTAAWPDGFGLQSCETIANPAASSNADADATIEVCSDLSSTAAPVLLAVAVVLLLLSPELGEFGVPGLISLKARVEKQERTSEAQEREIASLTSLVSASSRSTAQAHSSSVTQIFLNKLRAGDEGVATHALARLARKAEVAIAQDLANELGLGAIEVSIYRQVPHEQVLRQIQHQEADVTDFRPGFGATGQAFSTREAVVVTGDAVHNADYGLSVKQQEFFKDATIVGSAPLFAFDDLSSVRGCVTCISTTPLPDGDHDGLRKHWAETLSSHSPFFTAFITAFGFDERP